MRTVVPAQLEKGRIVTGDYASTPDDGLMGAFIVRGPLSRELAIISSGPKHNHGWEHVSVSMRSRTPTWVEMCFAKDLFWSEQEPVMQLHPPAATYVNYHPHCLHLWRPLRTTIPMPPPVLVGPQATVFELAQDDRKE
jgi:hypothetical protein